MMGEGGVDVADRPHPRELDSMAGQLADLLRRRDALSLEAACLAGVLAENGYGESQGALSTAEWMRHEFKVSTQSAHDLVNVGLEMSALEASSQAAFDHEIGFQHLAVLARARRQLGGGRFQEEHLLAEARESSVGRLWWRCQELRHASDPEGVEQEQRDDHERRALRITHHQDGRVGLSGMLDPVSGAVVESAIAPLARRSGKDDDRNLEQRTADALVEVCDHAMGQGRLRERPHLNVTATVGTLYQVPGSPAAAAEHGGLLSGVTVKRIACDCSIGRYVFGGDSMLIDVGRAARVVSGSQRRALVQRDQHCRWPGCTRPASYCEAHHVVHWIHGGPTDLSNLVLVCFRHHWMIHEGRWHLFLDTEERVRVLKPPLDLMAPPRGPGVSRAV